MTDRNHADTAVVTGASGWLGQNLVRALAPERGRVRCLVPDPDAVAPLRLVGPTVEVVVGDVRDPDAIDRLFEGVVATTVFHAAGVIHPSGGVREMFDVNVGGTEIVLDRARRTGASRLVHVSSNSPFGVNPGPDHTFDENSPEAPYLGYGASKREAEDLVRRRHGRGDVEAVIIRPPWFYGPHHPARQTRWLAAVRRGRFPVVGDGHNRRSLVAVDNLVHGLLRAEVAEAPGLAYWIADPEPCSMREVLATVRAAFRAEGLPAVDRTPRIPAVAGAIAEGMDRAIQATGRYHQAVHVLGELRHSIACSVERARREIGYAPATTMLDGMRASIRWSLDRGDAL